ncbi:MAG: hypothetical protein H6Q65_311 [Firmicutes bacterium]|nr:hypothetical protein [Bacillota bacterium]
MTGYFPLPYEGEALYSVMARYSQRTGIKNHSDLSIMVFGKLSTRCNVLTANKIDAFLENTQLIRCYSADDIIYNNTAFYPITSFLDAAKQRQVYSKMRKSDRGSCITMLSGMNQLTTMKGTLKYCPTCLAEDLQKYGEGYWRTIHQVPGVNVCPTHRVELFDECPSCGEKHSIPQYGYRRLTSHCTCGNSLAHVEVKAYDAKHSISCQYCGGKYSIPMEGFRSRVYSIHCDCDQWVKGNMTPSRDQHEINYALNVNYIYQHRLLFDLDEINQRMFVRLQELGYIGTEVVQRQRLTDEFIQYYGEDYLKQMGAYPQEGFSNWIRRIFRNPSRYFMYHLLMLQYLYGSVEGYQTYQPQQMSLFDAA